jgi:hypothetical protein
MSACSETTVESPPTVEEAPPTVEEAPSEAGNGDHWVEVSFGETRHRYIGDIHSYCDRSRYGENEPFELDLQITDEDDHGLWLSYEKFIGVYDMRSYPLKAKTYTKDTAGTGANDSIRKEIVLAEGEFETSPVIVGLRDRASSCHDEFTLSDDRILTGTLTCSRLYDNQDQMIDMVITFGCPLAEAP